MCRVSTPPMETTYNTSALKFQYLTYIFFLLITTPKLLYWAKIHTLVKNTLLVINVVFARQQQQVAKTTLISSSNASKQFLRQKRAIVGGCRGRPYEPQGISNKGEKIRISNAKLEMLEILRGRRVCSHFACVTNNKLSFRWRM